MSDKSVKVGDCNILLIDGNIISIDEGDYVNSYSMTVDEWEQIKTAVDHLIYEANNEKAIVRQP